MACEDEQAAHDAALAVLGQAALDLQTAQDNYDAALANAQATQAALDDCLNPNPDPNTNAWPAKKAKPKKRKKG